MIIWPHVKEVRFSWVFTDRPQCRDIRRQMDSSKPLFLRSSTGVSLHERFSQVLVDQMTRSRAVALNPILSQKRSVSTPSSLLGLQAPDVSQSMKGCLRRGRSMWERLGWQHVSRRLSTHRPRGFWSFTNKYRWRARVTSILRRRGHLKRRLGHCRILTRTNIQKLSAGPHLRLNLPRGRATAVWRRSKDDIPTKRQLDAELDEYMSLSKTRLDKQLDNYMSLSRSRLDTQLDEYMSMAGETLQWD